MCHEHLALIGGQLVERDLERLEQRRPCIDRVGSRIRRGQQILERQAVAVFISRRGIAERLLRLLAEEIRDPIARHAEQPGRDVIDRHQQPVRLDEPVEDVLENVLGIARVRHAPANEAAQAGLLPFDRFGDPPRPVRASFAPGAPRLSPHRRRRISGADIVPTVRNLKRARVRHLGGEGRESPLSHHREHEGTKKRRRTK